MKYFLTICLALAAAACLAECKPQHRGGRGGGGRATNKARRLARRSVVRKWFGPVEAEAECAAGPAAGGFDVQDEEVRPQDICTEVLHDKIEFGL